MGQVAMAIAPPALWEDFERLTLEICKIMWDDNEAGLNGRTGQDQQGVDVFGRDHTSTGNWVAVQCKKRAQVDATGRFQAGGLLSEDEITKEIEMAEDFRPTLSRYILATTAVRDVKTQEIVRQCDEKQRKKSSFGVSVWFWEDYQEQINQSFFLMYKFYDLVLKSRGEYDPDKHFLYLLQNAFSRPAFDTPFEMENVGDDFLQAMKSTQEVIRTGRWKDNQGKIIDTSLRASKLSNRRWEKSTQQISVLLQQIRDTYTQALKIHVIEQHNNFLLIHDPATVDTMNQLRADAVRLLNNVLVNAKIEPVRSQLLTDRYRSRAYSIGKQIRTIHVPTPDEETSNDGLTDGDL